MHLCKVVAFLYDADPFFVLFHLVSDWSRNTVITPEGKIIYGVPQTKQLNATRKEKKNYLNTRG